MRRKASQKRKGPSAARQTDVIRDVMLSAGECETWLTLEELARLTTYPPASISAQLRHLRKVRFGAFLLRKRPRKPAGTMRGSCGGPVWEYRLWRPVPGREASRRGKSGRSASRGLARRGRAPAPRVRSVKSRQLN